ncbi:PilZ domain-containing protein [Anaeromyxobacter oryzisoli]|uniref:PilZ domain-containing protein n=1 Tax=Anaeromyxobacter oryzisoli TaxID=2925408 RepID=UPI001F5833A7|nr:PilZ domain-containing protein [Anaeromyxobacter sp. SG63]
MGDRIEGHGATARAIVDEPQAAPSAVADRRDSRRIPVALLVRDLALGGSFEPYAGNLALGGVYFEALHPPAGSRLEVRFLLPGVQGEVHAVAEVLRVSHEGERFGAHLRFVEIPLEAEMAIARHLQSA